jgi:hypothetical protein
MLKLMPKEVHPNNLLPLSVLCLLKHAGACSVTAGRSAVQAVCVRRAHHTQRYARGKDCHSQAAERHSGKTRCKQSKARGGGGAQLRM